MRSSFMLYFNLGKFKGGRAEYENHFTGIRGGHELGSYLIMPARSMFSRIKERSHIPRGWVEPRHALPQG
ncbi:hypothetical protein [Persicobacter sp. CCB-QB2]|uniref:hypothetical protein n=1 Tax=Persicobacter sp. CCB-QB2 TaxID=1561025 RepID=UPI0006A9E2E0|nr:hypothetical protein [Persicobacter sp. CCB-QB2]